MASKYSKATQEKVHTEMHEMKEGKLKSGRSGKKVTNPKQAIAIGLSEARKEGKKVPPAPQKSGCKESGYKKKHQAPKRPHKKSAAQRKRHLRKAQIKNSPVKPPL